MSEFEQQFGINPDNPEARFELALFGLQEIQHRISLGGAKKSRINEQIQPFATEVYRIAGGKTIYVSGDDISIPVLDQFGHIVGRNTGKHTVDGLFDGVETERYSSITKDENPEIIAQDVTIGIRLYTGTVRFESGIEDSVIHHHIFAPVVSTLFMIDNDLSVPPEDDDEMAADIDMLLLNDPPDLVGLADYITEFFDKLGHIQKLHYIDHINSIFQFDAIRARAARIIDLSNDAISDLDEHSVINGYFEKFDVVETTDDTNRKQMQLMAIAVSNSGSRYGILINDVYEVSFS